MKTSVLRHPATPTHRERDLAANILARIAAHTTDPESDTLLALLILRAKVDGPETKLAALLGLQPYEVARALTNGLHRVTSDPDFNRLFHLIRSAL